MWSKRKADIVLRDTLVPGKTYDVMGSEPGAYARLLGLILAQARQDGMYRIAIGADEVAGNTRLRYFGPRESDSPCWWDMTFIPPEDYSLFVQAILATTTLERELSPRGAFLADLCGHEVRVEVTMRNWFEIELELID